jgi:predicted permease
MKLTEAWRLSRIPYKEVVYRSIAEERGRLWWGGFGGSRLDSETQNDLELTKKALRIAKFDKSLVAVFNIIAAVIPFTAQFFGSPVLGLTGAISLSLAVTFGFTALYAIQTLSSFVSMESSALLSTLPLAKDDFSLITILSFVRSVDYMVMGSILSQVAMVARLTASPLAILLMFVASLMNATLAVAVALWFSRMFHKNLLRGGRSKGNTVLRLVFIFMWGTLLMGVGFLLGLPWYIVPALEKTLLSPSQVTNILYCLLLPFSSGIAISNLVYPVAEGSTVLAASVAMIGYVVLAGAAAKWILGAVKSMSQGIDVKTAMVTAKDFSIKTRRPLFGYIVKDLKVSSRNPATALFFALPVLETAIVSLVITNFEVLKASAILVATLVGGIFSLLMPLALLNAEGTGLEYTKTLPVNANRIVVSKTLISTATYVPVPLALLVMALLRPLSSPVTILIPFFTLLSITSASIFEIKLFLDSVTRGKIAALTHDLKKLVTGVTTIIIPMAAYALGFLVSFSHILAILSMATIAFAELAIAVYLLKRNKRARKIT